MVLVGKGGNIISGYGLFALLLFFLFYSSNAQAAECWTYSSNATCTSGNGCIWKSDSWGSWCEQLSCWSLYSSSDCADTAVPDKTCVWQNSSQNQFCEQASCWIFSGTNSDSCTNNDYNLSCSWQGSCYSSGGGA